MIYSLINSIDTVIFKKLYDDSIDSFDSGSYPWHLFPPMTEEEKYAHLYQKALGILEAPNGVGWLVTHEGLNLQLGFGIKEGNYIKFVLAFIGKDAEGSKKWMYHPEYRPSRELFWEQQGVVGWILPVAATNSAIANHVQSRLDNYSGSNYQTDVSNINILHNNIKVTKT
jgi:hypothetical protein